MLHPNYWRRGLMQEAICAVVAYGFKTLKLHSIEGRINPLNLASANILSKCGFVKEAHFKEDFLFHGRFEDTAIYSLLSSQKQ